MVKSKLKKTVQLQVDDKVPVSDILPVVAKAFEITNVLDYGLQVKGTDELLDSSLSFQAQKVPFNAEIMFMLRNTQGEKKRFGFWSKGPEEVLLFGRPLEDVIKEQGTGSIPNMLIEATSYLIQTALQIEGIFRLSGRANIINELKAKLDAGTKVIWSEIDDPHCVSGLIKAYLRELPEPLLTFKLFEKFCNMIALSDPQQKLLECQRLVNTLPKYNRLTLEHLLIFLLRVASNSDTNKMGKKNLALLIGPNVLKRRVLDQATILKDTNNQETVTTYLLSHFDEIFGNTHSGLVGKTVKALYHHPAAARGELTFQPGDSIQIIEAGTQGLWKGSLRGHEGTFQITFVDTDVNRAIGVNHRRPSRFSANFDSLNSTMSFSSTDEASKNLHQRLSRVEADMQYFCFALQESVSARIQLESVCKKLVGTLAAIQEKNPKEIINECVENIDILALLQDRELVPEYHCLTGEKYKEFTPGTTTHAPPSDTSSSSPQTGRKKSSPSQHSKS